MEFNNELKESLCSFKISELLQKKGFENPCRFSFDLQNKNKIIDVKEERVKELFKCDRAYAYKEVDFLQEHYYREHMNRDFGYYLYCPSHDLAIKWLNLNFVIYINIDDSIQKDGSNEGYTFMAYKEWNEKISQYLKGISSKKKMKVYKTKDEAVEAALIYSLKKLI